MKKIITTAFLVISGQFSAQNLFNGLTACYALNGTGAEPVNNLNAKLSAVMPTADRFNNAGSALYFNGSVTSYVVLPNSPLLKAGALSGSCWVKLDRVNFSQELLFAHNGCVSFHEGYQLSYENATNLGFQIAKANSSCTGPGQSQIFTGVAAAVGVWYHLGFYVGADSLKLYVNGQLVGGIAAPGGLVYSPAARVYLGNTNLAYNFPLTGTIDNFRFYNRKLTGAEMNLLYTQEPGCIIDQVGLQEQEPGALPEVYPNPGNGSFVISNVSGRTSQCVLYNVLGKSILEISVEAGSSAPVSITGQPDGLYFLRSETGDKIHIQKLVKTGI